MAGTSKISLRAKLEDLGIPVEMVLQFAGTPTYAHYDYLVQTTTNVAQVLNLGSVSTVEAIIIIAKSKVLLVDTSYSVAFSSELTVAEGEFAIFKPSGTAWIGGLGYANDRLYLSRLWVC
jgi:hypothetical protein